MGNSRIKLLFCGAAIAVVAPFGFLAADSAGRPTHEDRCEVVAAQFSPGTSTASYVKIGENLSVPVTTEIPGAWEVRLNCNVLGRQELAADAEPTVGQRITVSYAIGRFSGSVYFDEYPATRR